MQINLNVPLTMMKQLTEAVVRLAADYADVHAAQLELRRAPAPPPDRGKFFYQSDKDLWEAEEKAKTPTMEVV